MSNKLVSENHLDSNSFHVDGGTGVIRPKTLSNDDGRTKVSTNDNDTIEFQIDNTLAGTVDNNGWNIVVPSLLNPTFVAVNSGDSDVVYGGFSTTGKIRKRILSTGTDTFFDSTAILPITDSSAWTDWQNRETLIYA